MKQQTPPVAAVAAALGLEVRRSGRLNPCPSCRATDKRGTVVCNGPRWWCTRCGEKGDTINLVSIVLTGQRAAYREAFAWLNERGEVAPLEAAAPVEPEKERAPVAELAALLRTCTPLAKTRNARVLAWCAGRPTPIDPQRAPAAVLPPPEHPVYRTLSRVLYDGRRVPWWPRRWSETFPLVVPAFTGHGRLAGLHARAVDPNPERKSTWPLGVDCRGLFFADPWRARPMLRGESSTEVTAVLFVEGLPDYLDACQQALDLPGLAVLGIESGSVSALKLVRFPRVCRFFVAQHLDAAGHAYANAIALQLAPRPVTPLPLDRVRRQAA